MMLSVFPPVQQWQAGIHTQYLPEEGRWHNFSTKEWLIVPHLAVNVAHNEKNWNLCQQIAGIISRWNIDQRTGIHYCQQTHGSHSGSPEWKAKYVLRKWIYFYVRVWNQVSSIEWLFTQSIKQVMLGFVVWHNKHSLIQSYWHTKDVWFFVYETPQSHYW